MGVRSYIHRRRGWSADACRIRRNELGLLTGAVIIFGAAAVVKAVELSEVSPIYVTPGELRLSTAGVGLAVAAFTALGARGEHLELRRDHLSASVSTESG